MQLWQMYILIGVKKADDLLKKLNVDRDSRGY